MGRFTKRGQTAVGNGGMRPDVSPKGARRAEMSKGNISAVERIIANTINETARGDPGALAARIVPALAEAGFRIVSAGGRENRALGPSPLR